MSKEIPFSLDMWIVSTCWHAAKHYTIKAHGDLEAAHHDINVLDSVIDQKFDRYMEMVSIRQRLYVGQTSTDRFGP